MEALTLPKKKNTISKGKLKKNIKNVICRPDKVFWPAVTEDQEKTLIMALQKYKVDIPEFKKPHWKELKLIPKEKRPKPPKLKKVDGIIFGITECNYAIQNDECSAVIIEETVNPRMIVEPLIELCTKKEIVVLCMKDLRKLSLTNFGVKTSCLGLKKGSLLDVTSEILKISKLYPNPKQNKQFDTDNIENMDVEEEKELVKPTINEMDVTESPYLYRTSKKTRVFVPTARGHSKAETKFIGQDFIEFSNKSEKMDKKAYLKMMLKRMSNNPDRVKKK